jgi:hypothetical protein
MCALRTRSSILADIEKAIPKSMIGKGLDIHVQGRELGVLLNELKP